MSRLDLNLRKLVYKFRFRSIIMCSFKVYEESN